MAYPTILAEELQQMSDEDALAFVDQILGDASTWHSSLIRYRLSADFQSDWKAQVGHWLNTAEKYGFLDPLMKRVISRANQPGVKERMQQDPNDVLHLILCQELAPAMVVYYLIGTGWGFQEWEPNCQPGADVDIELFSPDMQKVSIQVKAPDLPGRLVGYRKVEGEYDASILSAIDKAAKQLPRPANNPSLVVVVPNRTWPIEPFVLEGHLVGGTSVYVDNNNVNVLHRKDRGVFFSPEWNHVGGVVHLDYLRSIDVHSYPCLVYVNPNAESRSRVSPLWFPRGRVSFQNGNKFYWQGGMPGYTSLGEGTLIEL